MLTVVVTGTQKLEGAELARTSKPMLRISKIRLGNL